MKFPFVKTAALCLLVLIPLPIHARIVISEIMYDLEGNDTGREWVELQSNDSETVNIIGGSKQGSWRFFDGANHILNEPPAGGWEVAAQGFLVIAVDKTKFLAEHPGFSGLVIDSSFSLKNSGATLRIIDGAGKILDETGYNPETGGNGNGKTIERQQNGLWRESQEVGGSPGINNSAGSSGSEAQTIIVSTTNTEATSSSAGASEQSKTVDETADLGQITINEFMPRPEGGQNEWIELKNFSEKEQGLAGWKLISGQNSWILPDGMMIAPGGFLLIPASLSGIAVANDGAGLELRNAENKIVFRVAFLGPAPEGLSFSRSKEGDWFWSQPTPEKENIIPDQKSGTGLEQARGRSGTAAPSVLNTNQDSKEVGLAAAIASGENIGAAASQLKKERAKSFRAKYLLAPLILALLLSLAAVAIRRRLS